MKELEKMLLRIGADNDQDREEARKWWRESDNEYKIAVWDRLQVVHEDAVAEVITRLAALKLAELAEENENETRMAN